MLTFPIAFATLLLLAVWLMFFSRLSRRGRRFALVAVVAIDRRHRRDDADPRRDRRPRARPRMALGVARAAAVAVGTAPASAGAESRKRRPPLPAPATPVPPSPRLGRLHLPRQARRQRSARVAGDYPQFLGADSQRHGRGRASRRRLGGAAAAARVAPADRGRMVRIRRRRRPRRHAGAARRPGDGRRVQPRDGSPKWSHGDEAHYESTIAGEGPRATPTISRGRVFTLGSTGLLNCLDLETGKAIWRRDIAADNDSPPARLWQEQLAARRRRSRRRQRGRSAGPIARGLSSRVGRAGVARWRRPGELQLARARDAGRRPADCRAQSVERRRPRSGDRPRALESRLAAHGADRCGSARRLRESRSAVGRLRRRQPAPADFARWRRRQPDARVGEHAAQGQVRQPGRPRRLRVRTRRWRAGVPGSGDRRTALEGRAIRPRPDPPRRQPPDRADRRRRDRARRGESRRRIERSRASRRSSRRPGILPRSPAASCSSAPTPRRCVTSCAGE